MENEKIQVNTEPSLKGNLLEGVTTEAQGYSDNIAMPIMGRLDSVNCPGERGDTSDGVRDSLVPLVTEGVEANSTQPRRGVYNNDSTEKRRLAAFKGLKNKSKEAKSKSLANFELRPKRHSENTKIVISEKAIKQHKRQRLNGMEIIRHQKISKTMKERISNDKAWHEALCERSSLAVYTHLPNKPEKLIIDFKIKGLRYTGNGTHVIVLERENGKRWRKKPDFIFETESSIKVVEVMDLKYWHSPDEIEPLIAAYAKKGIQCLIIDYQDIVKDLGAVRVNLENFLSSK